VLLLRELISNDSTEDSFDSEIRKLMAEYEKKNLYTFMGNILWVKKNG